MIYSKSKNKAVLFADKVQDIERECSHSEPKINKNRLVKEEKTTQNGDEKNFYFYIPKNIFHHIRWHPSTALTHQHNIRTS